MDIQKRLDQLTDTDPKERSALFRFMAGLSDHERGKLFAVVLGKSHRYDRTHPDREKYGYVFIIEVELIKELRGRREIIRRGLHAAGTPERTQVLRERRLGTLEKIAMEKKKQKKKSPQKAILEKERPFIIEARSKGYSVGVIAEYLSKRHGIKISGATVRKFVLEHFREEENSESAGV